MKKLEEIFKEYSAFLDLSYKEYTKLFLVAAMGGDKEFSNVIKIVLQHTEEEIEECKKHFIENNQI